MIICFEGIDGAGKTTQIELLKKNMTELGFEPQIAKHPGQTKFGAEIRNLIINGVQPKSDYAHRLLFWADTVETMEIYKDNEFVIFDRHPIFSNLAYGLGLLHINGASQNDILKFIKFQSGLHTLIKDIFKMPDITFIIDIPVDIALERMQKRGKLTIIEKRGPVYFEKVKEIYLGIDRVLSQNTVVIDGTKSISELEAEILGIINNHSVTRKAC